MAKYFGKYRGKVVANVDPLHLGRIQVEVAAVLGEARQAWALPCTPYAGADVGWFAIPPVAANVWVEFEQGDPDYPIWSGCFWGERQLPQNARVDEPAKVQVLRVVGITLTWSDLGDNKGVTLEVGNPVVDRPLKMVFNADGIELNNNNETTIKIQADKIELKNRANSTVTMTAGEIELQQSAIVVKLNATSIELNCAPAKIELSTSAGIAMNHAPASAKFTTSGVEIGAAAAGIKVSPALIEFSNAAANIKLSPVTVNVNNGALEVI
jgi:Type VI secretion system/phage-baseplate injector OB domain